MPKRNIYFKTRNRIKYPKSNIEMKVVTINIPRKLDNFLTKLSEWGLIPSRSEVLRHACIKYCLELYELIGRVDEDLKDFDPKKFIRIPNGDGTYDIRELIRRLE